MKMAGRGSVGPLLCVWLGCTSLTHASTGDCKLHVLLGWLWPGILQSFCAAALHTHTHVSICSTVGQFKCTPYIALGATCYPSSQWTELFGISAQVSMVHDLIQDKRASFCLLTLIYSITYPFHSFLLILLGLKILNILQ